MKEIAAHAPSAPGSSVEPSRRFNSTRDAKDFLVEWIVAEARRIGVPLSEVERKMLYSARSGWTPPGMAEVQEAFDRYHDAVEYELKMTNLIRMVRIGLAAGNAAGLGAWNEAVRMLGSEDHYLYQMIRAAQGPRRRRTSRWKIWFGAILLFAAALAVAYWAGHR